MAKYKNMPISIATCTIKGDIAYLNNVTTLKEFKGQNVAKEVLSVAISTLKQKNVKSIMFATETGMYTEQFYKNLGFEVIDYGYCFE